MRWARESLAVRHSVNRQMHLVMMGGRAALRDVQTQVIPKGALIIGSTPTSQVQSKIPNLLGDRCMIGSINHIQYSIDDEPIHFT